MSKYSDIIFCTQEGEEQPEEPSDIQKVIAGLQLICKYHSGSDICAEHDEIYAGAGTVDKVSEEDKKKLDLLGWRPDSYGESWRKFT